MFSRESRESPWWVRCFEGIFVRFRPKLREMINFEQFSCGEGGWWKRQEGYFRVLPNFHAFNSRLLFNQKQMTEYEQTCTYVGYYWFHFGCVYCNFEMRVFFMWPCITNPGEVTNKLGTCFIGPPLVGRDIVLTFIVNYNPFIVCLFLSWPSLLGIQSKKNQNLWFLLINIKKMFEMSLK